MTAVLREAWSAARANQPMARAYDVAKDLGVSELELIASGFGTPEATRLKVSWADLGKGLGELGEVMALTRNANAVIEKHGLWAPFEASSPYIGIVHGDTPAHLDLRLFLSRWAHAIAVRTETPKGTRRSIQIFDKAGVALHKVFVMEDHGGGEAFEALVARYGDADQVTPVRTEVIAPEVEKPDAEIDVEGFKAAWIGLQDTHDFYPMTRRFGVSRTQAFRLAPTGMVRAVAPSSLRTVLETAAKDALSIMVFVGNEGVLEIHAGPVERIKVMGTWLNVLDPTFNLHVREDQIAHAWVVKKPTTDGDVTSLELFDASGGLIALLFGDRKPGRPEDGGWRSLADAL